jgi:hypothetical protein
VRSFKSLVVVVFLPNKSTNSQMPTTHAPALGKTTVSYTRAKNAQRMPSTTRCKQLL